MRIGIDAREIESGVYTGIGRALYNFLRCWHAVSREDECVLFSSRPLPFQFSGRIQNHVIAPATTWVWDQIRLPKSMRDKQIDLFYSPYYKIPLLASCPRICAVLDVMYLTFLPYRKRMPPAQYVYYQTMGRACLQHAAGILTCSEYSREDIVKVYGVNRKKITVIPLSVSAAYQAEPDPEKIAQVKTRYGISGKYLLYAGNFKPHKNVMMLLEVFALLAKQYPDLSLVLAGPRTDQFAQLAAYAGSSGLSSRVIFTGVIADEPTGQLLYAGADLFVMPSLYEGFGLPPVEAMACGTPVVCSDATSLPEACGGAAVLCDAGNPQGLRLSIIDVLEDKEKRNSLVIRGLDRVKELSQERNAKQIYEFLRNTAR